MIVRNTPQIAFILFRKRLSEKENILTFSKAPKQYLVISKRKIYSHLLHQPKFI